MFSQFMMTHFVQYTVLPPLIHVIVQAIQFSRKNEKDLPSMNNVLINLAMPYQFYLIFQMTIFITQPLIQNYRLQKKSSFKGEEMKGSQQILQSSFKWSLQIDLDNRNQKPSYNLELRASSFFNILIAVFVLSSIYPMLVPIGAVFAALAIFTESFTIARSVFIRQSEIYTNELLKTTFRFFNGSIILKLILSLVLFSKV